MKKENVSCLVQQDLKTITWFKGFPGSSAGKKNLPAMQETSVQFLGWEDPLERG